MKLTCWQTTTTIRSSDRTVDFKIIGTEMEDGTVEVCAYWAREAHGKRKLTNGSLVMKRGLTRTEATEYINEHMKLERTATTHMLSVLRDARSFCQICGDEFHGSLNQSVDMCLSVSIVEGSETVAEQGTMVVLCDVCYGFTKNIRAQK